MLYKLLILACVAALILGLPFRFTMAQGLAEAKLLPESWRRWLYGMNHAKKTN